MNLVYGNAITSHPLRDVFDNRERQGKKTVEVTLSVHLLFVWLLQMTHTTPYNCGTMENFLNPILYRIKVVDLTSSSVLLISTS